MPAKYGFGLKETQSEDTITPPESWDESEDTNNKTENNSEINNDNSQENGSHQEEEDNVTSEDVLEDDKKFGTIF